MKSTTLNVSFYCRPCKASKKGLAPIELSLIINGERAYITLPRKEYPETFKKSIGMKKTNPVKEYLEATRGRLNDIITEMMDEGIMLNTQTLSEYFRYGGVKRYTVQMLFDEYIGLLKNRVNVDLTPRSYRKYELSRDKFYTIISPNSPVGSITNTVVAEYMSMLKRIFNTPTANGYGQRVKTVLKYGMSKGIVKTNPFMNIHLRKDITHVEFLTEEEITRIKDTDMYNESLNRMRDLFVFQASCGLSYCDMAALEPSDYQYNETGQIYIHKKRAKTGVYFTSVVLPDGVEILKRYNFQLPKISNQKYNAALKFIKSICQIEKPLHTHIARHSYATRCLNLGIRLEVVAKLLGHSSTRLTQHYAKLLEKNIIQEVQDAFNSSIFTQGGK